MSSSGVIGHSRRESVDDGERDGRDVEKQELGVERYHRA